MSRVITVVPTKPRSNRFQYYNDNSPTKQISGSGGGWSTIDSEKPEDEILIQNTFSQLPVPNPNRGIVQITLDTKEMWVYDVNTNTWQKQSASNITVNKIGTGNVVTDVQTNPSVQNQLNVTMGNSGINYTQTGTGNTIDQLQWNQGTNTLTSTLGYKMNSITNQTDTTTNLDFLTDATQLQNGIMTARYKTLVAGTNVTLVQSGSNVTINATGGGSVAMTTTGTGNTVADMALSGSTFTETLGYRVNAVAESADSSSQTSGIYFRSAAGSPTITNSGSNSTLNLPYQRLMAGSNISFSQSGSNITINSSGGSGGGQGNVISNLPSGQSSIKMYRYEYYYSSNVTINPGSQSIAVTITPSMVGMTSIYNLFPSIIFRSSSQSGFGFVPTVLANSSFTSFQVLITNTNYSGTNTMWNTIYSGTEIDVLVFGI